MFDFLRALFGLAPKTPDTRLRSGFDLYRASLAKQATKESDNLTDATEKPGDPEIQATEAIPVVSEKPIGPAFARALMFRTTPYETEADCDLAIQILTEAPEWLRRDYPTALHNRGFAYFQKGEYERAIDDFSEAIRLCEAAGAAPPTEPISDNHTLRPKIMAAQAFFPLRTRGEAFLRTRKWQEAIADFTRALTLDPKDVWSLGCRGVASNEAGDYENAIVDTTAALSLCPDFVLSLVNRGYAYRQKGEFALALSDFAEALRIDPQNAAIYEDRAKVYLAFGQPGLAFADEMKARELLDNQALPVRIGEK